MFEDLDDPAGTPGTEGRLDEAKARARRMRLQRRALTGAGGLAVVALTIAGLVSLGDEPVRPVNVAAQPDGSSSSEIREIPPETTAVGEVTTTTLAAPAITTTTRAPVTTTINAPTPTTTATPTTVPPQYQFTAHLQPEFSSGASGTAGADAAASGWRVTVTLTGLGAGVNHQVYAQGQNPDGSFTQIHPVCQFTARADGTGGCTGTVQLPSDPQFGGQGQSNPTYCSVMGGDNAAAPGRVVAGGSFAPS